MTRFFLVSTWVFTLAACGTDQGLDDAAIIEAQLGEDFGGLTETDEDEMFGDEATFAELGEDAEDPAEVPPADDAVGNQTNDDANQAVAEAQDDTIPTTSRPSVYGIIVTWGRQIFDPTAEGVVTWDPTLSTDCGYIGVRRRIAMEPLTGDRVVRPRTSAQSVSIESTTLPSFDGIALVLVIPAGQTCAATDRMRFRSPALDADIELPLDESLADLVLRHNLGDGNNVIALGHQIEPPISDACLHGHLVGRWMRALDAEGNVRADLGRFYGRVINEFGELRGHVRGIWGRPGANGRRHGQRLMFGKYIAENGEFRGLLAGRYGLGLFGGGWHVRAVYGNQHLRGLMGGGYVAAPDAVPDGGLFRGRYASMQCLRTIDEEPLPE